MADVREIICGDAIFPAWKKPWDEYLKSGGLERWFPVEAYNYYQFKHDCALTVQAKSIVEFGVWRGYGALAMLSAVPEATYVGYDLPLDSKVYMWHADCLEHARKITAQFKTQFRLVNTQSIKTLLPERFDLAHVDGEHSYAACRHEICLALEACSHVLVDDTNLPDLARAADGLVAAGRLSEMLRFTSHCLREQRLYRVT